MNKYHTIFVLIISVFLLVPVTQCAQINYQIQQHKDTKRTWAKTIKAGGLIATGFAVVGANALAEEKGYCPNKLVSSVVAISGLAAMAGLCCYPFYTYRIWNAHEYRRLKRKRMQEKRRFDNLSDELVCQEMLSSLAQGNHELYKTIRFDSLSDEIVSTGVTDHVQKIVTDCAQTFCDYPEILQTTIKNPDELTQYIPHGQIINTIKNLSHTAERLTAHVQFIAQRAGLSWLVANIKTLANQYEQIANRLKYSHKYSLEIIENLVKTIRLQRSKISSLESTVSSQRSEISQMHSKLNLHHFEPYKPFKIQ
jgi:hypothetical protein